VRKAFDVPAGGAALALFAMILGTRLWMISALGSDLAYWDPWDGGAMRLFKPWLDGTLTPSMWIAPHNEHRLLFTRLLSLGLLAANGQWDVRLECAVNALLMAGIGTGLFLAFASAPRARPALFAVCAVLFLCPFGYENTLEGYQSMIYLLVGFGVLAIRLVVTARPWSPAWIAGSLTAVAAVFTMASGVLTAAAVAGMYAVAGIRDRGSRAIRVVRPGATVLVFGAIAAGGAFLLVAYPAHAGYHARSAAEFLRALARILSWPNDWAPWSLVNWLPWCWLAAAWARRRAGDDGPGRFAVGLGLWVLLQAAAVAFGRGAGAPPVSARYSDVLAPGLLANFVAFSFLLPALGAAPRSRQVLRWAAMVWVLGNAYGLIRSTRSFILDTAPARRACVGIRIAHVEACVATGRVADLGPAAGWDYPYPDAAGLAAMLRDPTIRSILPVSVRPPADMTVLRSTGAGFRPGALAPAVRSIPNRGTLGSWGPQGKADRGTLTAKVHKQWRWSWLEFRGIGSGDRVGLAVKDSSGRTRTVRPAADAPGASDWASAWVWCPGPDVELTATDDDPAGWLGFAAPREAGPLSWAALRFVRVGRWLLLAGVLLAVRWYCAVRPPAG